MGKGKFDSSCPECCQDAVVSLEHTPALVCCILNCIPMTSGIGTMVSACINDQGFIYNVFLMGFLQWFFAGFLGPWIWSIIHGLWLLKAEKK